MTSIGNSTHSQQITGNNVTLNGGTTQPDSLGESTLLAIILPIVFTFLIVCITVLIVLILILKKRYFSFGQFQKFEN